MDKYLQRIAENHILRDLQQFPIVGIVGPRQVGKTTLAKLLMNKLGTRDNYLITPYSDTYMKSENLRVCSLIEYLATMNIEEIHEYCISKPAVTEGFPFNDTALVFKVSGKMFPQLDL